MSSTAEDLKRLLELLNAEVETLSEAQIVSLLEGENGSDASAPAALLDLLHILAQRLFIVKKISPELRAWAESHLTDEEIAGAIQAIRSQEGPLLEDVIRGLEQDAVR